jgi:hypothetical protein
MPPVRERPGPLPDRRMAGDTADGHARSALFDLYGDHAYQGWLTVAAPGSGEAEDR